MEFIVGTEEYMFVTPTETTGALSGTFQALGVTATYSIYAANQPLISANAVVDGVAVNEIAGNTFKCKIMPDTSWTKDKYDLYLKITNIPGYAEKPRFGPFRFGVVQ